MIQILGIRRIIFLSSMLALNALLALGNYLYLVPVDQQRKSELASINGQISTVQTDINRMQVEFDQLNEQRSRFEDLRARGFISDQQRRQAEKVFEAIRKQSGVTSAKVIAQPAEVVDNEEAQKAGHKILSSLVSIELVTLDTADIYRYIYLLDKFFPGHVSIESMVYERKGEVTGSTLRAIASGENPDLVAATIEMKWRTMIPEASVIKPETIGGVP
jgi:hypothetical protein